MGRIFFSMLLVGSAFTFAHADNAADAAKSIEGEYAMTTLTKGGKEAPKEVVESFEKVTIKDGTITLMLKDESKTAKIIVDGSKKPATIDLIPSDGPEVGKTMAGIYKLEKDQLTLVFTGPDKPRPEDFAAGGSDEMKVVLTRKVK